MCSNEQVTSLAEMCTSASTSSAVAKTHPDYGQQQGMADDRAVEGCGAPNIHQLETEQLEIAKVEDELQGQTFSA